MFYISILSYISSIFFFSVLILLDKELKALLLLHVSILETSNVCTCQHIFVLYLYVHHLCVVSVVNRAESCCT